MDTALRGRTCGGCTACCFTHAVAALEKRLGEWCPHCDVGAGCRIYPSRPEQCAQFSCLWIQGGWGDEHDRPDRLKVVVGGIAVNVGERSIQVVQFIETEAGAIDRERARPLIEMFRAKGFGICIARLLPSGKYSDADYEIPANLLSGSELEPFKEALARLDPFGD
jgi:hypothetical protein